MQLDDKICYCFHVSKRKIMNFLRVRQPRVPSQLSECGSAGTGCGWCVPFLKKYFAEWQAGGVSKSDDLNPDEYARVYRWLSDVRAKVAVPRSGHDTRAWVRLAGDGAAFGKAGVPFGQVEGLWREGLLATE